MNKQTVIQTKAEQLQVFTAESKHYSDSDSDLGNEESFWTFQTILIAMIVLFLLSIFVLLFFKMNIFEGKPKEKL